MLRYDDHSTSADQSAAKQSGLITPLPALQEKALHHARNGKAGHFPIIQKPQGTSLDHQIDKGASKKTGQDILGKAARFLPADISFLTRYDFSYGVLKNIALKARLNGVEAHEELIASGLITAERYYRAIADYLGLQMARAEDLCHIEQAGHQGLVTALRYRRSLFCRLPHQSTASGLTLVMAPKCDEIEPLRFRLSCDPDLAKRILIAPPQLIADAYLARLSPALERHASQALNAYLPVYSAFYLPMWTLVGALVAFVSLLALAAYTAGIGAVTTPMAILFFGAILVRFIAALSLRANKQRLPETPCLNNQELPVYSVLVAAYKEANIIAGLVSALKELHWPAAKLDIKLVLEADDHETIAAARAAIQNLSMFEIVLVPAGTPRTKPRALNYALPLARGDYLVIYDAEDRPHPMQLKAAYHRYQGGNGRLACLQAPLLIDNAQHSFWSGLFAVEYAGLFDGVLPALARYKLPIMLGGTSNHFKTEILRSVGAWDPYNVTEDADLGIRLSRLGYHVDVLDLPTYEEAPVRFSVWLKQRTRWFKGWMQTGLVHMRHPGLALSQLGLKGFLIYHLVSSVLLASALGYPFFLFFTVHEVMNLSNRTSMPWGTVFTGANFLFAYATYGLLSYRALAYRGRARLAWNAALLPVYWIFLTIAAWRAFIQLGKEPHVWEKTPHGEVNRRAAPWQRNMLKKSLVS